MDETEVLPVVAVESLASRCRFYREVCGLPARVRPDVERIVFTSGSVGAVTMPAELAAPVKAYMLSRHSRIGPVISHPRSKRWTFLVRPDIPDEVQLFAELFRRNASVARWGAEVVLPSPYDRHMTYRVWVNSPRDGFRPSGMAVVEAMRSCPSLLP
ncbi:DNA-directed RNA polymerase subunit beta [Nocardia altamirensis]|uniref:DNA-directed RNA polymerase subunit beta n=1 Tax=Nocardia altamirensis TaxID=472158 RepID=UPI00083FF58F|nr:DNA-directed RNA polymerase subunit beta [Nocardia altamirensis]